MEWVTKFEQVITTRGDQVIVEDPRCKPSRNTFGWVDAFERPDQLFIDDFDVCVELLQELARALPSSYASPRRTFWRAFSPGAPTSWSFTERSHGDDATCTLTLTGGVLTRTCARWRDATQFIDDAFFHGPMALGLDDGPRRALRAHVSDLTGGAIAADQGFPDVDYAALTRRIWEFDVRSDGESSVIVDGAYVQAGYYYGRDQGSSTYPVERVITSAPGVWLGAPEEMEAEIMEYVKAAVRAS